MKYIENTKEICTDSPVSPKYYENYMDFIDSELMEILEYCDVELYGWEDRHDCWEYHAAWINRIIGAKPYPRHIRVQSAPLTDRSNENHIGLVFQSLMSALGYEMPEPIDELGTLPIELSDFKWIKVADKPTMPKPKHETSGKEYDVFFWPSNPYIKAVQIMETGLFRFGELSWWEKR